MSKDQKRAIGSHHLDEVLLVLTCILSSVSLFTTLHQEESPREPFERDGADYAEWMLTTQNDLAPGEIVCIDETTAKNVKWCSSDEEEMAGIVSTYPAFIGNAKESFSGSGVKVAMIGQVPVLVSGIVAIGDLIGQSSTPGIGAGKYPKLKTHCWPSGTVSSHIVERSIVEAS